MREPNLLDVAEFSALGAAPCRVVPAADYRRGPVPLQSVVIGVDGAGALPAVNPADFDVLLTTAPEPPAPWVGVASVTAAQNLADRVGRWPFAATIGCQVLRTVERLPFNDALLVESLAYSTLLGGREFADWLARRPPQAPLTPVDDPIRVERDGETLILTLADTPRRNAMTAVMRDALYTALANALEDPGLPNVVLRADGRCFSTGGSLAEFGTTRDLAAAHIIRSLHANARLCHALGGRLEVVFHGACVGSGLEVPAAAARRSARCGAFFQLPELSMGLIPGAGGTVTVSRAIGRHRAVWMFLSGARLTVGRALSWGLVHRVLPS
ncbi:enoyl-CoA hydratase/isomerase family protein [Nitrospirillum iridis]|uniref:Enoyl-CoA hydratase/isomerase family protein n=1 Tax=Nitrospirillum iridis TaxID=765888 RepID=A0A7X0EDZ9_9PROT|nr:enoyl-CoA hydratase/isomerase family protein [Nitrospirillum iridis]MBB6253362.1 hypothetical protein [Nitrospirillum iridis]